MYPLLYIILFLIPNSVVASGLFTPPATDTSLFLLGSILGPAIGSLTLDASAPVQPILAKIMENLNLIVVSIGICISGYVSVLSITNTAQEGTVMGKKWSAVWIPMRSIIGLGLMVPSPGSGYSMIQTTVMWVVMNGIGAADMLWSVVVDGLSAGFGTQANITNPLPSDAPETIQKLAQKFLNANVCIKTLQKLANLPAPAAAQMNTPIGQLYTAINGSSMQPSPQGAALISYANQLGMYKSGKPGYNRDFNGGFYSGQYSTTEYDVYVDKTDISKIFAYSMPSSYNFGVPNGNSDWKNICGTITTNAYVLASDYAPGLPKLAETEKDLFNIFNTTQNLVTILNSLMESVADSIVNNAVYPQNPISTPNNTGYSVLKKEVTKEDLSPSGYFDMAVRDFTQIILSNGVVPGSENNQSNVLAATIAAGKSQGWITASGFYFVLAHNTNSSIDLFDALGKEVSNLITVNAPECTDNKATKSTTITCRENVYSNSSSSYSYPADSTDSLGDGGKSLFNVFGNNVNNYQLILGYIAMYLAQANLYSTTDGSELEKSKNSNPDADEITGKILGSGNNPNILTNDGVIQSTSALMHAYNTDPILAHAQIGYNMMISAEVAFATTITVLATTAAAVGAASSGYGYIQLQAPHEVWATALLPMILATVLPVLLITWTMGASLFMYVPLIPFMIFTITTISWLIAVVEAVIAAPILALAMVTPSNDELGRLSSGIGLLANLFLKPSLMIIGFLLASRLYAGAISLVNWGMAENYALLGQSTSISWMAALAIYISFVLTLANRCFSLIHVLPDKIMRWIGVAPENTDTSEELGAAKRGQEGANKAGDVTASGAAQLGGKIASKGAKRSDRVREKAGKDGG